MPYSEPWRFVWYAIRVPTGENLLIIAEYPDVGNDNRPDLYVYKNGVLWLQNTQHNKVIRIEDMEVGEVLKSFGLKVVSKTWGDYYK
jgi:hypothetical protein